jgi:hypothetical protein
MPRPPRRPDAQALHQVRLRALATGGLRRVFPLRVEEWVARAPWDAPAGVILALLDTLPKRRRAVFEKRLRAVMERGFAEERVPSASRKITPGLLAESVATPPATGALKWAYRIVREGAGRGHSCDPLTLLTHKRVVLEWLDALPRRTRNPAERRRLIRDRVPALVANLNQMLPSCPCGAASRVRTASPQDLVPSPGQACRQILAWYHGRTVAGMKGLLANAARALSRGQ